MDRMLVVIFNNEKDAYKGREALQALDRENSIVAYGYAVITKNPDGTSAIKEGDNGGPIGTLAGTSLGSLIGLLGGPAGLVVGAATGMVAGAVSDLHNASIGGDFVDDVSKQLTPGRTALVAEIKEDWTAPVDARMEALGGVVFRRAVSEVRETLHAEDVAAIKADMAQLKAEHAKAMADRKAKLNEKISQLEAKLQHHLHKAKEERQASERKLQIKANLLAEKASAMFAGAAHH